MTLIELEAVVNKLNARTDRTEQILPTLATKQDLLAAVLATRQDLIQAMSHFEERLRSHMMVLHEDAKSDNRLLAEHLVSVIQRLDRLEQRSIPPLG